jgi:cell division protein FtsW (lipid II flippase)
MTFAVFCFMVWVLLIIEGLNCEIIVLCSLVAISLAAISNFIIFIFEGEKKHPQNVFLRKKFSLQKTLRL